MNGKAKLDEIKLTDAKIAENLFIHQSTLQKTDEPLAENVGGLHSNAEFVVRKDTHLDFAIIITKRKIVNGGMSRVHNAENPFPKLAEMEDFLFVGTANIQRRNAAFVEVNMRRLDYAIITITC